MSQFSLTNLRLRQQLLLIVLVFPVVLTCFFILYTTTQLVRNENSPKKVLAASTAQAVIEKVDRNFYERFGDVQAFAYNKLARECALRKKVTPEVQDFINTMVSYYVLYDLMLIADKNGKILVANTQNKDKKLISTAHLIGNDVSSLEWFKSSVKPGGPEGGAFYSDFKSSEEIKKINSGNGYGVEFAAPIKDSTGEVIGVWYNFASWKEITAGIREEAEISLQEKVKGSRIFITDGNGKIIEAADANSIEKANLKIASLNEEYSFPVTKNLKLSSDDHLNGYHKGNGAYTYKGNQWYAVVFIPRTKFNLASLSELKMYQFLLIIASFLIISVVFAINFSAKFSRRINRIKEVIWKMSKGELATVKTNGKDELAEISGYVNELTAGLQKTAAFAEEIGKGRLQAEFTPLSDKDILGHSLLEMKANLARVSEEDKKRGWVTQGLAQIGEILRTDSNTTEKLYDKVLSFVIKYTGSNQGALFILENQEGAKVLKLEACYAYDRKKFLDKTIEIGEGLVGQVLLEKDYIYLTDVPKNYISISSGLGDARPNAVLIVPLKINDEINGALEIASFSEFEKYQIEFIQKIAENIASVVSTVRINNETRKLLSNSQLMTEQLQMQEEEMRQNVEELEATQEEVQRREQMLLQEIHNLKNQIREMEKR
jgi:methyl-accepting chemotaxis protein